MISALKSCLLTLVIGLGLGACAETGATGTVQSATPGAAAGSANPAAVARSEYRIASQDTVDVNVYQMPDLSRIQSVDGQGNIVLPLVGAIRVSGRTTREVETDIAGKLRAKYLQNPQVFVSIKDAIGLRVTVEGAVKKPGVVVASGEMTLLRVLAESGGFTDTADQAGLLVFRQTPQGRTVARFDANAIRSGAAPDPAIYGGDTIVVDDSTAKTAWKQFRDALGVAGLFKLFL